MHPLDSVADQLRNEQATSQMSNLKHIPNDSAQITSVTIPTRNRVDVVERALRSYIENTQKYGRSPSFVVVDDSDTPAMQASNRAMLASLKESYGASLFYAGAGERAAFVEKLIKKGSLPRHTVEFALLNPGKFPLSYGASRNALLLHTVGELVMQADDDTICKVATPPGSSKEPFCTSFPDPTQFWFFPDHESAINSVKFVEEDLLGIHESMLGKSMLHCMSSPSPGHKLAGVCTEESTIETDSEQERPPFATAAFDRYARMHKMLGGGLEGVSLDFVRRFEKRNGNVRVTFVGSIGHSGMGKSCYYLFREDPTFGRLIESEKNYRMALTTDHVLRVATRPTISTGGLCMGINLGLDNRRMLPPFFPVQRGEDSVFGYVLWTCFGGEYVGFLPRAVVHHSPKIRPQSCPIVWNEVAYLQTHDMLSSIARSFLHETLPDVGSHDRNLESLGKYLVGLGKMPQRDFQETVHNILWFPIAMVTRAQLKRMAEPKPTYWVEDMTKCVEILRALLLEDFCGVPSALPKDLVELFGIDSAWRVFQELTIKFGELLQYWPQIVETAAELRCQEESLAQPI